MMKKNKKLIVANWKMNPATLDKAKQLFKKIKVVAKGLKNINTVICPPFLYLNELRKLSSNSGVDLGVQNIFEEAAGAHTGEISAVMAYGVGARYAILGHSERRNLGETSDIVNKKVKLALSVGFTVIVCIGEKERDAEGDYLSFLKKELIESLKGVSKIFLDRVIIAYEPVWAIGRK